MNAPTHPQTSPLSVLWYDDLQHADASASGQNNWLWHGYLAPGNITLLTSQWKAGKTTLVSLLLDRLKAGGELGGQPVRPGRAAIVSEEPAALWRERSQRFDYAGHVCWLCRPFTRRPDPYGWEIFVSQLHDLHRQCHFDLIVLDPLAAFFPAQCENNADAMLAALAPVRLLAEAGPALLLLHHPRKKGGLDGQAARGSGALCGHADIQLELHWFTAAATDDRRRRLLAWSRFDETPRQRILELSPDGRDYRSLGDLEEVETATHYVALLKVLEQATLKMTAEQILNSWPQALYAKPSIRTLTRALARGLQSGALKAEGAGVRNNPHVYWLTTLEELWKKDPFAKLLQDTEDSRRKVLGF